MKKKPIKIGFTVKQDYNSTYLAHTQKRYGSCEIKLYLIIDPVFYGKVHPPHKRVEADLVANIHWQTHEVSTPEDLDTWVFWYAGELKADMFFQYKKDVHIFNNITSRIFNKLDDGLREGPHAVIDILKRIGGKQLVDDPRLDAFVYAKDVNPVEDRAYSIHDGSFSVTFLAPDLESAQKDALIWFSKAAAELQSHRDKLTHWIESGMAMDEHYMRTTPEVDDPHKMIDHRWHESMEHGRVQRQVTYVDFNSHTNVLDRYGAVVRPIKEIDPAPVYGIAEAMSDCNDAVWFTGNEEE